MRCDMQMLRGQLLNALRRLVLIACQNERAELLQNSARSPRDSFARCVRSDSSTVSISGALHVTRTLEPGECSA